MPTPALPRRHLRRVGIEVPALGLGGGGFLMDLHTTPTEEESASILRHARAVGIEYFDTAPFYRASEARLGTALGADQAARIATKAGLYNDPHRVDFSPETVRDSVARSLDRLGRTRIDVMQLHELTFETWDAMFEPGGALRVLDELRDSGAIASIGVTSSDPDVLLQAVETGAFDLVQLWRRYNLLDRTGDRLLDAAAKRDMAVVIGAPLASGLLTGAPGTTWYYEPPPDEVVAVVERLQGLATEAGTTLAACALRFLIDDERVSVVLTGVDTAEQLDSNVAAATAPVAADVITAIAEHAARLTADWHRLPL